MTLYQIIRRLETFSLTLPNVRTASDGDVYTGLNDNPELKYGVFFVTQNTHQELEDMDRYGLTLFYIDRLDDTLEDNRLQIQSIGKEVLSVILRDFCEEYNIDFPTVNYTPFTQKFKDETAGVYAQITLDVIKGICADDFSDIISIYQTKTVNLTENGQFIVTPDESYTALEKVIINVDVECESYEQGFEDGFESGVTNQKNKLTSIYIDENGQYNRTDGFSSITVDVPQGDYQQGYEDGMEAQKALLSSITITTNGDYSYENGYSAITVNVPQSGDYQDGFEDGVEYQKSLLSSATFNQNGDYSLVNGWSAITIDVSGYTQEDIDRAYWQGYSDGLDDCPQSGETDYSNQYLTIESLTDNNRIRFWNLIWSGLSESERVKPFSAKLNDGEWVDYEDFNHYFDLNEGDKLLIKGNNARYTAAYNTSLSYCNIGNARGEYKIYGNIMSLIYGDDFRNKTSFPANSEHNFAYLFKEDGDMYIGKLVDAENLILPATALTRGCYRDLFQSCTHLNGKAPELPATTLVEWCYNHMFYDCHRLSWIKCMATDISANDCTYYWNNFNTQGIFIKPSNMSSWTIGHNGIQKNWTIIDAR